MTHATATFAPSSLFCLLTSVLCLLSSSASAQPAERRDIFAQGSARTPFRNAHIWAAQSRPGPDSETLVLSREVFGDAKWKKYPLVPARAIAITQHSGELVLLIQGRIDRSWAWFSVTDQTERFSYGPLLPDKASILAIAGDHDSLFALGQPSPKPATTRAEAGPSTLPTTRPTAAPVLFRLQGISWVALAAPWPSDAPAAVDSHLLSLEVIADQPHLAVLCPDNAIRVYQLSKDNLAWLLLSTVPTPPRFQHHKLLDLAGRPGLWLQTDSGPGFLFADGRSAPLTLSPPLPAVRDMDMTVAGDQLRLIFFRDSKFFEQRYKLSGSPDGSPAQLAVVSRRAEPPTTWVAMAVMTVLAIFLVITFLRRRPTPPDEDANEDSER